MTSHPVRFCVLALLVCSLAGRLAAAPPQGYYRQPAISSDQIVFVAEGDLWKVPVAGGAAVRLTSHPGHEAQPAVSPDGRTLAFTASYEGPTEAYTMPLAGGLPTRRTYTGDMSVWGWTPQGRIIAATGVHSTLPNEQLVLLDGPVDAGPGRPEIVPLAQAADGCYDDAGTLYFTRLAFQGSHTRRYRGGTAQSLWRFAGGDAEARSLTADYPGTSRRPMWWQGRVYFASDRSGVMNLWSMKPDGGDLKQHTRHADYEVLGPSLGQGRIVYQHGADIRLYDIAADVDRAVPITLSSDFDQMREKWIDEPMKWVSAVHLSPDGDRVALTARGRVFVAPHRQGRLVEAARRQGVRCRDARFMPDGKTLLVMSDESNEVELWTLPANGVGDGEQLTRDGVVLRWEGVPSPDGKLIAHHDKNQRLWVFDVAAKSNRQIDESSIDNIGDLAWSPDSRWLAYRKAAENAFSTIRLFNVADGSFTELTTDRWDSYSPAWHPDGKWLYFLSNRNLKSVVESPWGSYQPEPFLDKKSKIYAVALKEGERFPFAPADELHKEEDAATTQPASSQPAASQPSSSQPATVPADKPKPPDVVIEPAGLAARLYEVPVPPGNYGSLAVNDKALFWTSRSSDDGKTALSAAAIARENVDVKTVVADIKGYELSLDGKKLLIRKDDTLSIVDAAAAPAELDKKNVVLAGWTLSVIPREEWRQMFVEAWRLERDYFYDTHMHGVDWKAIRAKYEPLVDRVSTRAELSDLIAQMVAELSALHIFVVGGDLRKGDDHVAVASLGAVLRRDAAAGGWRIERIYTGDPDEPGTLSPLAKPDVNARVGDVIVSINGIATLSVPDPAVVLRQRAGQQVLLRLTPGPASVAAAAQRASTAPAATQPTSAPASSDVIVTPISPADAESLRYRDWELSRRDMVERLGENKIGYVHLRAMGNNDFTAWAKAFYPVFNRQGLIIDVRHNGGGNIDSWIIGRLLRKAWFTWSQRIGQAPNWNMQYAFRGHVAVLCDEWTASDGEAFTEGVKRLKLGRVFGTRTWGGEIWLSFDNYLVDGGIASAGEYGVYGPEGTWLIEGHGVEPDVVVDNLPHATFKGEDAQLKAAIEYLQQQIREKPVEIPRPPRHPDKSLRPASP